MPNPEVAYLDFNPEQSKAIALASKAIAESGGPEVKGATRQAFLFANQTLKILDENQRLMF